MVERCGRWRTSQFLLIFCLLYTTTGLEVKKDEWEELHPDLSALHRLKGLSEGIVQDQLYKSSDTRENSEGSETCHSEPVENVKSKQMCMRWEFQMQKDLKCTSNDYTTETTPCFSRWNVNQCPSSLLDGPQEGENWADYLRAKKKDLEAFLEHLEKQKTDDRLITASEISHSYGQKLLVLTDKEPSTSERVRQEYSMDPQYSVIVQVECLNNDSCVPDVDINTVVKVFGSVSEDGQTISGLTGSSLAELILKPSLEAAGVFSLDGNTTTEFQHRFIRTLMVRGVKAVLETIHDNHQMYKVMEEPDTVTTYRTPKRPVDHSTQYDHQQIIMLQDNQVVRTAAESLYEKHPTVSSLYVLDNNLKPRLIHGEPAPLSENSRLVLVGHGNRDKSGEMRLAGFTPQEVIKVIESTDRVSDQIKTTSVVACDVGSDEHFIKHLAKGLRQAGIETELHMRNSLVQVKHTGEKITQEFTSDGEIWRHEDDSKKVVATMDKNGDVIIRNEAGSKEEAIFNNERNFLGKKKVKQRGKLNKQTKSSWPEEPRRFIDPDVYKKVDQTKAYQIKQASEELEALSWGLFHREYQRPKKVNIDHLKYPENVYIIGGKNGNNIKPDNDPQKLRTLLHDCYEINSGEDVLNVIHHYAKTGENKPTYLKISDWIFLVDPSSLYVYPVGKKLLNTDNKREVMQWIVNQNKEGRESYTSIRSNIPEKKLYADHVKHFFLGEPNSQNFPAELERWCSWYFAASVIAESARNFRTFLLMLMALDMIHSGSNVPEGLKFLFEGHPMARGGSWINTSKRGFSGAAAPIESITSTREADLTKLGEVITLESKIFTEWKKTLGDDHVEDRIYEMFENYKISEDSSPIKSKYRQFKAAVQHEKPLTQSGQPSTSGALSGHDDGSVTMRDLKSASELENSFKHEAFYSKASASVAEEIHTELRNILREDLGGMHVMEGTERIENGQFICQRESSSVEPVEFKAKLSAKTQKAYEELLRNMDRSIQEMEEHSLTSSHSVSKMVEHVGNAVGVLGLMLGAKGAVRAFEHCDIKDGVMGTVQTVHGATHLATSAIARTALSSEARYAKAAATIMRNPAMKGTMKVIPIVGIGFGIYNVEEDLKRKDTLGYIDAAFDIGMIALDVVELAQPELAPFIAPINVAVSVVRMVVHDIYMGIENELHSLPEDAGVLRKIGAGLVGLVEGVEHFHIHVASFFYDWRYDEIEEGKRLVAQISDYHKYYTITKEEGGMTAIDFSGAQSSWNGGGISFCLADNGPSELCMDYFVSSDESPGKRCWSITEQGSTDIILGTGESHELEHKTLQKKVLLFIPAGSVTVVSGYKPASYSRFGTYRGNSASNRFFAVQKAADQHMIEVLLSYYYRLFGEPGDDTFFLGPQKSYVEGSGGKDTYLIPENGGKTIINNYDPSKALDTLHFSVDFREISVSKSGDDVVLKYRSSHTVTIQNWFLGEPYRHMTMMSGDGVLFEISSTVVSSVRLVATGINKMFMRQSETIDASYPFLSKVTNIVGTQFSDVIIGNDENNLIDGGGGGDLLAGRNGEDVYNIKGRLTGSNQGLDNSHEIIDNTVVIENFSTDNKTDLAIIEADLHNINFSVEGDDIKLQAYLDTSTIYLTLKNWFRSAADRHLIIVTKDMITFTISENKSDCLQIDLFPSCIRLQRIDYSSSSSPLVVDLQEDTALNSLTEVRGSKFNDDIKGNNEHNVFVPGSGQDFLEGRGGEDWYVITPDEGVKTISNQSPDLVMDKLFLKASYESLTSFCEQQNIIISVNMKKTVVLQKWFLSKYYQHLQIRTSDGVTAGLKTNITSCGEPLLLPLIIDYRNTLHQTDPGRIVHGINEKIIVTEETNSVKEIYGSSGYDIIIGNKNDNLLDPYYGGATMTGGEGEDTYIIKHAYGNYIYIDNYAEDGKTDTVLLDMDFINGGQIDLVSSTGDLTVTINTKGAQVRFALIHYSDDDRSQHLEFLSSDGVRFRLKSLNSSEIPPQFQVEAFKVTLNQAEVDCRLDLSTQKNLSKVQTVQGCPPRSSYVVGNNRDNTLIGGWKDDTLDGGEGDDTLIGGHGADILIGGMGEDTLYGEEGNDTMVGDSGRDVFIPGPGADLVDGGSGRDTVLYRGDHEKGSGVYVNLLTGQGHFADAEGDVLKDVENVVGTIYSDILVAGYESSLLKGSDGNDVLVSTGGDYLVGGDGSDIYLLAFDNGSVTIDNCAKDNATDVLFFNSYSFQTINHQVLPDKTILTFIGPNETALKVVLKGRISDDSECGHLKLFSRESEISIPVVHNGHYSGPLFRSQCFLNAVASMVVLLISP